MAGGVWAKPVCREVRSLFAPRHPGAPLISSVPPYTLAECRGPFCIEGPQLDTTNFLKWSSTHPFSRFNPAGYADVTLKQATMAWSYLEAESGSSSLVWAETLTDINIQAKDITNPVLPVRGQVLQGAFDYVNAQIQRMAPDLRPTVNILSFPQITGPTGFGTFLPQLGMARYFDTKFAADYEEKHNCVMAKRKAYTSPLCATLGNFAQARLDWNKFKTSTLTALNTEGVSLVDQFRSITACLDALLAQAAIPMTRVMRVNLQLTPSDLQTENLVRAAYIDWMTGHGVGITGAGVTTLPTRTWAQEHVFLDRNALIAVSLEATTEPLLHYYNERVFGLPKEYSHVVTTPGLQAITSDLYGCDTLFTTLAQQLATQPVCTPMQDGTVMYAHISKYINAAVPSFIGLLTAYRPTSPPGFIIANWAREYEQALVNGQFVLGIAGVGLEDCWSIYNQVGPSHFFLQYFGINYATTYVFNGTQGVNPQIYLPMRDESLGVDLPLYAGGIPSGYGNYSGITFALRIDAQDFFNITPRPTTISNPPAIPMDTCDGTDFNTCPFSAQVERGNAVQFPDGSEPANTRAPVVAALP